MARRTKEEAAETRERLLDTAEAVFLRDGVARTSLQRIADAAGLTRGAIYWHFRDKAELFNAMMERVRLPCEAAHEAFGATPGGAADPVQALRDFAWVPIARMLDDERTRRVFTIAIHRTEYADDMQPARDRHLEVMEDFRQRAERLLDEGCRRGRLDPALDRRAASIALMALIDGLLTRATLPDLPGERMASDCQAAIALFLRGLAARA